MVTWQKLTERRPWQSVSGGLRSEALWSRNWDSSTATLQRRSESEETSRVSGRAVRSYTGVCLFAFFSRQTHRSWWKCDQVGKDVGIMCHARQWDYVSISEHLIWANFLQMSSSSKFCLFWVGFVGKIMRSQWWCVLTCPNIRRMPKREAWCPCPASWVASHTSVTSQHWQEARADRWAYSNIIDLAGWGMPCWN